MAHGAICYRKQLSPLLWELKQQKTIVSTTMGIKAKCTKWNRVDLKCNSAIYIFPQCLSAEAVLEIFDDEAAVSGLTQDQFFQVCPVLLQQLDSRVCVKVDVHGDHGAVDQSLCKEMEEPTGPSVTEGIAHGKLEYGGMNVTWRGGLDNFMGVNFTGYIADKRYGGTYRT